MLEEVKYIVLAPVILVAIRRGGFCIASTRDCPLSIAPAAERINV
jgi:hypothetical protein